MDFSNAKMNWVLLELDGEQEENGQHVQVLWGHKGTKMMGDDRQARKTSVPTLRVHEEALMMRFLSFSDTKTRKMKNYCRMRQWSPPSRYLLQTVWANAVCMRYFHFKTLNSVTPCKFVRGFVKFLKIWCRMVQPFFTRPQLLWHIASILSLFCFARHNDSSFHRFHRSSLPLTSQPPALNLR